MILERALWVIAAAVALATAAAVSVFALAFAIYALLEPHVGPAGAAALVAAIFALTIAVVGLSFAARAQIHQRRHVAEAQSLDVFGRIIDLIRDKPFAAAGIAAAAGLFAIRNPALIVTVIRAFFEGWSGPERPRR